MAGKGGGAWKVAYADFVTAMMAFFLVMWITEDKASKSSRQSPNTSTILGERRRTYFFANQQPTRCWPGTRRDRSGKKGGLGRGHGRQNPCPNQFPLAIKGDHG